MRLLCTGRLKRVFIVALILPRNCDESARNDSYYHSISMFDKSCVCDYMLSMGISEGRALPDFGYRDQ
jgi:hypothetical protein